MHDWAKRQEEVYSGIGFGETKRSFSVNEYRYRLALRYIGKPPKTILDVGCCDGFLTEYLGQRGFDVVGMDLPKVVEKAKKLYPKRKFVTCNLDTGDNKHNTQYYGYFDIVCALEIIEHMFYDAHFLQRMALYAKKGGLIILTTPATPEKIVDDHIRYYPLESLRKLCEYSGFKVTKLKRVGEYHVVIGEKR